jgi:hypothetical protein
MYEELENCSKRGHEHIQAFQAISRRLCAAKSEVDIEALEFEAEVEIENIVKATQKYQEGAEAVPWQNIYDICVAIGLPEQNVQHTIDSIKTRVQNDLECYGGCWCAEKTKRYWKGRVALKRYQWVLAELKGNAHFQGEAAERHVTSAVTLKRQRQPEE